MSQNNRSSSKCNSAVVMRKQLDNISDITTTTSSSSSTKTDTTLTTSSTLPITSTTNTLATVSSSPSIITSGSNNNNTATTITTTTTTTTTAANNNNNRKSIRSNDKFHRLFPSIPINEQVLQSCSCAYSKTFGLVHGMLYLTNNYLCFYSKAPFNETILMLKWQHVNSISKANYLIVFPTAIRVDTNNSSYIFSFTGYKRSQTLEAMIELWRKLIEKNKQISNVNINSLRDSLKLNDSNDEELKLNNDNSSNDGESYELNDNLCIDSNNNKIDSDKSTQQQLFCRSVYENQHKYWIYDFHFNNKNMVTVSRRYKKTLLQNVKLFFGLLIPGFFNISRIDSLLPICFLMCVLLLLNAFVLLNKVNQVDELFTRILKPL